jgi:hypothetical protein
MRTQTLAKTAQLQRRLVLAIAWALALGVTQPTTAQAFLASINLSTLDGSNGFRLDGPLAQRAGRSVSAAGDINGDGFGDLIVGAFDSSYVVFGKGKQVPASIALSSLNGSNGFRLDGGDNSAHTVSAAGDLNGDHFGDLIVGATFADPNGTDSGSSYVVFGKRAPFSASLSLTSLNGANGFRLNGMALGDRSGVSVSAAGDVNGDNLDDLIVGAFRTAANGIDSGSSYVVFGRTTPFAASLELSSLNGANGFRMDGTSGDLAGLSVSAAGDVNADKLGDLIIGAPNANPYGLNTGGAGSSYVVFGRRTPFTASFGLASLNGNNGFRLDGAAAGDLSGYSVSSAGDFNGDSIGDLLVGAFGADPHGSFSGSSCVVFGKNSPFTATLAMSSLSGANGFCLDGVAANDNSGASVSAAGDVNGDGLSDLIVGAYGASPNGSNSGSSYVVFGTRAPFGATLALSALNGSNGFRLDGVAANSASGFSVSSAGDFNNDGFGDLIVGTPNACCSYVLLGRNPIFKKKQ